MEARSTVNKRKITGAKRRGQVSSEKFPKVVKPKPTKAIKATKKMTKNGNKKQTTFDHQQSDITSSADEMPLISRMSSLEKRIFTKKSTTSRVIVDKRIATRRCNSNFKQLLISTVNQNTTQQSIASQRVLNQEEVCKELFDKCNKQFLFNMMFKELDAEEILKGYKEKRNTWEKQKIQEEASRVLDINLENQSTVDTATKISSLQKVLQELLNLVESRTEFLEMILKTYGRELDAVKFFELLDTEQMKQVVGQKLSTNELMDLFKQSDNRAVIHQILEMASLDAIIHEIQTRNDSEASQTLLKVLLEMVSELVPDAIIEIIKSKKFFRTSESLLNYMLENFNEIISMETKKNISNVLINQFSINELVDLSHEAIKSSLSKNNERINIVEIGD